MTITITSPACAFSGFGIIAIEVFSRLREYGHDVWFHPMQISREFTPFPHAITERFVPKVKGRQLVIAPLQWLPIPVNESSAWLTMYESTLVDAKHASLLNSYSCVIVPTDWMRRVFENSKVGTRIHVCPLGIEPEIFHPMGPPDPVCRFGFAAWLHPSYNRKNAGVVIDAWKKAFAGVKDVELHLKIMPGDNPPTYDDKRIKIHNTFWHPHELARWYASLSAFICPSRCEGWGLMAHEAMACGTPVIGVAEGGLGAFMNGENGYPVWGKLEPHKPGKPEWGYDWMIDVVELCDTMRRIYWDRQSAEVRGGIAAMDAAELTWDATAHDVVRALEMTAPKTDTIIIENVTATTGKGGVLIA